MGAVGVEHEELVARREVVAVGHGVCGGAVALGVAQVDLGVRIAGDGGDERMLRDGVFRGLEVAHHRQLGVGEGAQHEAVVDIKAGDVDVGATELFEDGRVVERVGLEQVFEGGFVEFRAEFAFEQLGHAGIDLPVVGGAEGEVVAHAALGGEFGGGEQERGVGSRRAGAGLLPGCEAPAEVEGADALLFFVLAGFAEDPACAQGGVGAVVVGEAGGEFDGVSALERAGDAGLGSGIGAEVEGAALEVFEVEQAVAAAGVDQLVGPAAQGAADRFGVAGTCGRSTGHD